jgi:hypothetical protein
MMSAPLSAQFAAPMAQPGFKGLQAAWGTAHRDAATVHPVFFTERLQRSPFVVDPMAAAAVHANPVAHGYAYPETSRLGARL